MRIQKTLEQVESLFNLIQRVRDRRIARRMADHAFVIRHFPYHEVAARRETAGLFSIQIDLMQRFA